ncbi:MAG: GTPase ObgE [Clostridia bacterium]|nr:GTPase ObgE [Clostridia bacterium]NLS84984.1 GTPase ObgE [Oscillospiraceae bacterium]
MFIDTAKISIRAGNGGDGAVSFHREKYVAAGGPDGGDGGKGGDVIFIASDNLSTLMDFRYKRKYAAQPGENGGAAKCSGRKAPDLVIKVPRGTVVRDAQSGLVIADVSGDEQYVVAKGGKGGWGNSHFATPTRQIPKFARPGQEGESLDIRLELKLIADVGLIGFPNVGKSTIISVISAAKPKIANYHFTTLSPVLGVVSVGHEASFVCADIPGLIEGASDGVGLGHDFLRHVDRCRLLLHVVDVSECEGRVAIDDFKKINEELLRFSPQLAERPQIVLGNKCDIATDEQIAAFKAYIEGEGLVFMPVSAATRQGLDKLPAIVYDRLLQLPPVVMYEPEYIRPEPTAKDNRAFEITVDEDGAFNIESKYLEKILMGSDVDDYESLQYFQRQLTESGVIDKLLELGVKENDTIRIGDFEFDYIF